MVWKLELVGSDDCVPVERIMVCELGEIVAPADLDETFQNRMVLRAVQFSASRAPVIPNVLRECLASAGPAQVILKRLGQSASLVTPSSTTSEGRGRRSASAAANRANAGAI